MRAGRRWARPAPGIARPGGSQVIDGPAGTVDRPGSVPIAHALEQGDGASNSAVGHLGNLAGRNRRDVSWRDAGERQRSSSAWLTPARAADVPGRRIGGRAQGRGDDKREDIPRRYGGGRRPDALGCGDRRSVAARVTRAVFAMRTRMASTNGVPTPDPADRWRRSTGWLSRTPVMGGEAQAGSVGGWGAGHLWRSGRYKAERGDRGHGSGGGEHGEGVGESADGGCAGQACSGHGGGDGDTDGGAELVEGLHDARYQPGLVHTGAAEGGGGRGDE